MSISSSPLTPLHPSLPGDSSTAHPLQLTFLSLFPVAPLHASHTCSSTHLLSILAHAISPSPLTFFHPSLPCASSVSAHTQLTICSQTLPVIDPSIHIPTCSLWIHPSLNHPSSHPSLHLSSPSSFSCGFIHCSSILAHIYLSISFHTFSIHPFLVHPSM